MGLVASATVEPLDKRNSTVADAKMASLLAAYRALKDRAKFKRH